MLETPEIKAKIRGEAPEFGASGKQLEETDFYNQVVKGVNK